MFNYTFDSIVGNVTTIELLKRAIENQTLPNFMIFNGELGTGKSTSARIVSLALTCDNPKNGLPCFNCLKCKASIQAFESTGDSGNVKIVNVGSLTNVNDAKEMVNEIFVMNSGQRQFVYILEEAHAIKGIKNADTALLAEIDRIPSNMYIIMCTTSLNDLSKELQSRALIFNFSTLTTSESKFLLGKHAKKLGIKQVPAEVGDLIISSSRGIPRLIIQKLEFVMNNTISLQELKDYLQVVSDSLYIQLFLAMKEESVAGLMFALTDLLESSATLNNIINGLKDFLIRVVFLLEGGICDGFTKQESDTLKIIFCDKTIMLKVVSIIESFNYKTTESDFKLAMFKTHLVFTNRSVQSVVSNTKKRAAQEHLLAEESKNQFRQWEQVTEGGHLKKLTIDKISNFGGDKN